jgi:hypothetical protein
LTEYRDALDRLAQALLQEEVLERDQVLAIVNAGQNTQDGAGSEQATQQTLMAGSEHCMHRDVSHGSGVRQTVWEACAGYLGHLFRKLA